MDLVSVVVFSISMAIWGSYQVIPFTFIRPDMGFPFRLRGGLRMGYTLGKIGEAIEPFQHPVKTTSVPTEAPIAAPTSVHVSTLVRSARPATPPISLRSCFVESPSLASAKNWTSAVPSKAGPSLRFLTEKAAPAPAGPAGPAATRVLEEITWLPVGMIQFLVYTFWASTIFFIVGVSLFVLLSVYGVCKHARKEFLRKVYEAHESVNSVKADTACHKARLTQDLEAVDFKIKKEVEDAGRSISSTKEYMLHQIERRAQKASSELLAEIYQKQKEYIPFPTPEELLADPIRDFKAFLSEMQEVLFEDVESLQELIIMVEKNYEQVSSDVKANQLGNLPQIFRSEREGLQEAITAIREAHDECPDMDSLKADLYMVRKEAAEINRQVSDAQNEVRVAAAKNETMMLQIPKFEKDLESFKSELCRLENGLTVSRLAVKATPKAKPVNKDDASNPTLNTNGGEFNPAKLGSPPNSCSKSETCGQPENKAEPASGQASKEDSNHESLAVEGDDINSASEPNTDEPELDSFSESSSVLNDGKQTESKTEGKTTGGTEDSLDGQPRDELSEHSQNSESPATSCSPVVSDMAGNTGYGPLERDLWVDCAGVSDGEQAKSLVREKMNGGSKDNLGYYIKEEPGVDSDRNQVHGNPHPMPESEFNPESTEELKGRPENGSTYGPTTFPESGLKGKSSKYSKKWSRPSWKDQPKGNEKENFEPNKSFPANYDGTSESTPTPNGVDHALRDQYLRDLGRERSEHGGGDTTEFDYDQLLDGDSSDSSGFSHPDTDRAGDDNEEDGNEEEGGEEEVHDELNGHAECNGHGDDSDVGGDGHTCHDVNESDDGADADDEATIYSNPTSGEWECDSGN